MLRREMAIFERFSMKGRTAFITGAGQGIGRATVTAFAEAGADLVLAGISLYKPKDSEAQLRAAAQEAEKLGVKAIYSVTDMRERDQVQATMDKALSAFGKVDALVNGVGGGLIEGPFLDVPDERWVNTYHENVMTAVLGSKIVGAHMVERGYGAIVNYSSLDGRGPTPLAAHYASSKAAVANLTETAAAELGPLGVRVNCIAPYVVKTENMINFFLNPNPGAEEQVSAMAPLRRLGNPDEMAAVALFLCSDAASYVTGQVIHVSGGAMPGSHLHVDRDPADVPGLGYS